MIAVHNFLKLALILGIFTSLSTGCANHATGGVNPGTNLSALKTMYVKQYPSDNSGVNEQIADKLRSKGVTVTTGTEVSPSSVDAVVTYVDKWMWDITMYMLELTITIRDPKTDSPIATGNSLHTSLTRKSQTEMVDEVVNNIYNSPKTTIAKNASETPTPQPALTNATSQQVLAPAPVNKTPEPLTQPAIAQTSEKKLKELKRLYDAGLISKEIYLEQQKAVFANP